MTADVSDPTCGETENSLASQSELLSFRLRPCLKKGGEQLRKKQDVDLWPMHSSVGVHTYICMLVSKFRFVSLAHFFNDNATFSVIVLEIILKPKS